MRRGDKIIQPQMNVARIFATGGSTRWEGSITISTDRHTFGVEVNGMNHGRRLQAENNAVPGKWRIDRNWRLHGRHAPGQALLDRRDDSENGQRLRASWVGDKFFQPASTPGATGLTAVVVAGSNIGNSVPDPFTVNERRGINR